MAKVLEDVGKSTLSHLDYVGSLNIQLWATLRALGFRGAPVVVSVMLETMLLALLGGILGAAIAWLLFDHYTASTLGSNFTQIVFAFQVSPDLLWRGLKWALAMGLLGGLFPALRAARLSVTDGLREL